MQNINSNAIYSELADSKHRSGSVVNASIEEPLLIPDTTNPPGRQIFKTFNDKNKKTDFNNMKVEVNKASTVAATKEDLKLKFTNSRDRVKSKDETGSNSSNSSISSESDNEEIAEPNHVVQVEKNSSLLKNTGKITITTDIILILLSFVLFLTTIIMNKHHNIFQYVMKESLMPGLLKNAIEDVKIFGKVCDKDYESIDAMEILKSSYSMSKFEKKFHNNSHDLPPHSGHDIDPSDTMHIRKGELNKFKGAVICIKRIPDTLYYENMKYVPKSENCVEGYRQCGILSKKFGNKLCYKSDKPCPLNFVTIRPSKGIDELIELDEIKRVEERDDKHRLTSVKYKLEDDSVLELGYGESTFEVVVDFQITETQPCMDLFTYQSFLNNLTLPDEFFPAQSLNCDKGYSKKYPNISVYDMAWKKVGNQTFYTYLDDNDALESFIPVLEKNHAHKELLKHHKITLFRRGFLDIDLDKCGKFLNTEKQDFHLYKSNFQEWIQIDLMLIIIFSINMIAISSAVVFSVILKFAIKEFFYLFLSLKAVFLLLMSWKMISYSLKMNSMNDTILDHGFIGMITKIESNPLCFFQSTYAKYKFTNVNENINTIFKCTNVLIIISFAYLGVAIIQTMRSGIKLYHKYTTTIDKLHSRKITIMIKDN